MSPKPRRHPSWSSEEAAEFQLLELEALYHEAPVGLCFVDTELRFLRINERLAAITGKPVQEHVGTLLGRGHVMRHVMVDLVSDEPGQSPDALPQLIRRFLKDHDGVAEWLLVVDRDGARLHVEL